MTKRIAALGLALAGALFGMALVAAAARGEEKGKVVTDPQGNEMVTYYLGLLKRGPKWTPERTPETAEIQEGHMAHIQKTHAEGKLVVAGPIADDSDLRGILVYKVPALDEARALAEADPAVKAGRLVVELHPWMVQKGVLP